MNELKMTESDACKINKKLLESLENYNKFIRHSIADMPLGCLCLDSKTEAILIKNGFRRVFDLVDTDLTEIKGFGKVRINRVTSSLDQFLAMG